MRKQTVEWTLLYATKTPARWFRAAIATVDQQLAIVCCAQWRCAVVARGSQRAITHGTTAGVSTIP
jgi:hypothetical protein